MHVILFSSEAINCNNLSSQDIKKPWRVITIWYLSKNDFLMHWNEWMTKRCILIFSVGNPSNCAYENMVLIKESFKLSVDCLHDSELFTINSVWMFGFCSVNMKRWKFKKMFGRGEPNRSIELRKLFEKKCLIMKNKSDIFFPPSVF